jgi:hypothetical protein
VIFENPQEKYWTEKVIDEKIEKSSLGLKNERKILGNFFLGDDNDKYGEFCFEKLSGSYNLEQLKKYVKKYPEVEKYFLNKKVESSSDYINIDMNEPNMLIYMEATQLLTHEMFHLYQALTFPILINYTKLFRRVYMYEWYTFNILSRLRYQYKLNEQIISLNSIKFAEYDDGTKNVIFDDINGSDEALKLINEKIDGISIFEIIEGLTIAYQLITTKDIKCDIFTSLHEKYLKAYNMFLEKSDIICDNKEDIALSRIVFLFIANTSLLCAETFSNRIIPTFLDLSKTGKKYVEFLKKDMEDKNSSSSLFRDTLFGGLKALFQYDSSYTGDEINFIENRLSKLSKDNKKFFYILCKLLNLVIKDALKINPRIFFNEGLNMEDKALIINNFYKNKFPSFGKKYFLPLLLSDYMLCSEYFSSESQIKKLNYKSHYKGLEITVQGDSETIDILNTFNKLLDTEEEIMCCKKHGYEKNLKKILDCNEEDSYKAFFNQYTNLKLEDMVKISL